MRFVSLSVMLLAVLLVIASPVLSGGGVIQFRGVTVNYEERLSAEGIELLPGGRVLLHNPDGFAFQDAVEARNGPDNYSGWYYYTGDGALESSGVIQMWGEWQSTDPAVWGSDVADGWSGTYSGTIKIAVDGEGNAYFSHVNLAMVGQGHGSLDGWTIRFTSIDDAVFGHMTPPSD
jgi:hypothetical protein